MNQTRIDVDSAIEHLDLDVGITQPNGLTNIQQEIVSPLSAGNAFSPSNGGMPNATNGNFMVLNQRNSPSNQEGSYLKTKGAAPYSKNAHIMGTTGFNQNYANGIKNYTNDYNGVNQQNVVMKNKKVIRQHNGAHFKN